MKIVTGYKGIPHITSNEIQAFNQGIFGGSGNYVLNVGQMFNATLTNATTVTIQDGEGVMQGVHFRISPGDTEIVTLSPGTNGYKRYDLICARYTKSASTGVESVDLVVVEGTPDATTPVIPSINTGSILTGGSPVDFPLYRIRFDGLTPSIQQNYVEESLNRGIGLLDDVYTYNAEVATNVSNLDASNSSVFVGVYPAIHLAFVTVIFRVTGNVADHKILATGIPIPAYEFMMNGVLRAADEVPKTVFYPEWDLDVHGNVYGYLTGGQISASSPTRYGGTTAYIYSGLPENHPLSSATHKRLLPYGSLPWDN